MIGDPMGPFAYEDLRPHADALLAEAERRGTVLRLMGGMAIRERARDLGGLETAGRRYADLDVVGRLAEVRSLDEVFRGLGYEPDQAVNTQFGTVRRIYHHPPGFHVDLVFERLEFCHEIDLRGRLELVPRTLAPAGGSREPRREPPPAAAETPPAPAPRPDEVPLPFSVAIEAHQSFPLAVERVAALRRAEPGIEFYVAPITVGGVVYYRVMAGPAADPAGAERLMQRLVEAGQLQQCHQMGQADGVAPLPELAQALWMPLHVMDDSVHALRGDQHGRLNLDLGVPAPCLGVAADAADDPSHG